MNYNSLTYILLIPVIVAVYYCVPRQWRNALLLMVSLAMYTLWWPAGLLAMAWVIMVSYLGIRHCTHQGDGSFRAKSRWLHQKNRPLGALWLVIAATTLPLVFFKYLQPLNAAISGALHVDWFLSRHPWAIPVGLSFYTLQAIALEVDVWKGRLQPARSLVSHAAFMCFFPITVSGPIVRGDELLSRLDANDHKFDPELAWRGVKWLIWGLFMKLAVADSFALFVTAVETRIDTQNGLTIFVSAMSYTIQIYADFAGYSLMALGTAALLGFRLRDNFLRPLFSVGIKDFWRRWHLSLSTWLRDYIYIPLGGSRCSRWRSHLNVLVTFVVSGLWHGAGWSYLLWGFINGMWLIVERVVHFDRWSGHWLARVTFGLITFLVLSLLFILFSHDVPTSLHIMQRLFTQSWCDGLSVYQSVSTMSREWSMLAMFAVMMAKEVRDEFAPQWLSGRLPGIVFYAGIIVLILVFGVFDRGGQFIYMHF